MLGWTWIVLVLSGLVGCEGEKIAEEPPPSGRVSIVFPRQETVVREDTIPIWLGVSTYELFEQMTVRFNGVDITHEFLPWGGLPNRPGSESVATVRPRPGHNEVEVIVEGQGSQVAGFQFKPRAMPVRVRVLEGDVEVPARVSFHGVGETPDPTLASPEWRRIGTRHRWPTHEHQRNFVYTEGAPLELHLPLGRYEVLASRGPAYSMARAEIVPGDSDVDLVIARVMNTEGWISADFHVHAIPSGDSAIPLWDRVVSFWAQGVDVIVASDHHTITDYRAELAPHRSLPQGFAAIPGAESGYPTLGHWNFWPLSRDETSTARVPGGIPSYGGFRPLTLRKPSGLYRFFDTLNVEPRRREFGDFPVVVQLNHPRGIPFHPFQTPFNAYGYLSAVGYDPELPLDAVSNGALLERPGPGDPRPVDVDAIELLNRLGYQQYPAIRADWFAWIREGFVPTATANTDSHWIVVTEAGYPRNWVRYEGPLPVDAESLARSLRARQVVGSTGPLITLEPWEGEGRPLREPIEELTVIVRGPPWMPIEQVRIYLNGELAHQEELPPPPADPYSTLEQVHRVRFPLSVPDDSFITVEAGDRLERLGESAPHDGPLGRAFPLVRVLAFTNPLLVDPEGDGSVWDREQGAAARTASAAR